MTDYKIEQAGLPRKIKVESLNPDNSGFNFSRTEADDNVFLGDPNAETETEDNYDIGLDFIANDKKKVEDTQEFVDRMSEGTSQDEKSSVSVMNNQRYLADSETSESPLSHKEIQHRKSYGLDQLKRLRQKGILSERRLGMEHSLSEIEDEVARLKKGVEMENGIDMCRKGLMACVGGIEWGSRKMGRPLGLNWDGWSGAVMSEQHQFDSCFEELVELYGSSFNNMRPELKLVFLIGGSGFMFQFQKAMIEKAVNSGTTEELLTMMKKMTNGGNGGGPESPRMRGPSDETEELYRQFENGDFSDIASSTYSEEKVKTINVPVPKKRRGRPKKNV